MAKDWRKVFVVHGRDGALRDSMFAFLRALGLSPIEWSQAIKATGNAAPFIGEVLEAAFSEAQAAVVLLSGDDLAHLREAFQEKGDPNYEKQPTPQPRPNVLFEAGMAFGRHPSQTILVQIGTIRPFSDIAGRHVVRLSNAAERRHELANRLLASGCKIDLSGQDWYTAGNFGVEDFAPTEEISRESRLSVIDISLNDLDPDVVRVLVCIGQHDAIYTDALQQAIGISIVRLRYYLDILKDKNFVSQFQRQWYLEREGRAFLVKKGYA